MIREAVEKEYENLVEISKNDGFRHPNSLTLEWIIKRKSKGDKFYVYVREIKDSPEPLENHTKKQEDFHDEKESQIIGFICFQPQFSQGARLHFISVLEKEQGKGIGTELVNKAKSLAKEIGKKKLYLYVHQRNKRATNFYLRTGFEFAGVFIDKYGEGEHALLMVEVLD